MLKKNNRKILKSKRLDSSLEIRTRRQPTKGVKGGRPHLEPPKDKPPIISECEKMRAVQDESQAIGDFIEWLSQQKGIHLAKWHKHTEECHVFEGHDRFKTPQCGVYSDQPIIAHYNIEHLLAEYFKIDLKNVEEEKRKILEELRSRG